MSLWHHNILRFEILTIRQMQILQVPHAMQLPGWMKVHLQ